MNESLSELTALEQQAQLLLQGGNTEGAAAVYQRIAAADPDHGDAMIFFGEQALVRGDIDTAARIYERASSVHPDRPASWYGLASVAFEQRRFDDTLQTLQHLLTLRPQHVPALLLRGATLEQGGRRDEALPCFFRAIKLAERAPPDRFTPRLRRQLGYAAAVVRAALEQQFEQAYAPLEARHGAAALGRVRSATDAYLGKTPLQFGHPKWRPDLMYISGLPPRPWLERGELPMTRTLEQAIPTIRAELLALLRDDGNFRPYVDFAPETQEARDWRELNGKLDWSCFYFYHHGRRDEDNCARCPATAALLDSLDLMRVDGHGPEIMFSVLRPHTRIKPHYGSVNGRVVIHVPLIIPPNCGALRVAGEARSWVEGECLVFDDSFEHEAWNDSDAVRVVLIVDTWNPALTPAEREAFGAVLVANQRFQAAQGPV